MRSLCPKILLCALCASLCPRPARAIEWPSNAPVAVDPIRELRWGFVSRWIAPNHPRLRPAMDALSAAPSESSVWFAQRAVLLRLLDQEDLCRAALANAVRLQPDIVLTDTDVGLTQAWLMARARDWSGAFDAAMVPLARIAPSLDRERLLLDMTHWSVARGPEGIPPALTLLRQYLSLGTAPRSALVQVTAALLLARVNRTEEAAAMARAVSDALRPELGSDNAPLGDGALVLGEGDAATGAALLLTGRAREAVEPLTRASTSVPLPWRAFTAAQLAQARRAPAMAPAPSGPQYPLPNAMRID